MIAEEQWLKIAADAEYLTWDEVVECHDLPLGAEKVICSLGYYGKPVQEGDGLRLAQGIPFSVDGYALLLSGVEPPGIKTFKTLEEAKEYIEARLQWTESNTCFMTDYVRYRLHGFKLSDVGINWEAKRP